MLFYLITSFIWKKSIQNQIYCNWIYHRLNKIEFIIIARIMEIFHSSNMTILCLIYSKFFRAIPKNCPLLWTMTDSVVFLMSIIFVVVVNPLNNKCLIVSVSFIVQKQLHIEISE